MLDKRKIEAYWLNNVLNFSSFEKQKEYGLALLKLPSKR